MCVCVQGECVRPGARCCGGRGRDGAKRGKVHSGGGGRGRRRLRCLHLPPLPRLLFLSHLANRPSWAALMPRKLMAGVCGARARVWRVACGVRLRHAGVAERRVKKTRARARPLCLTPRRAGRCASGALAFFSSGWRQPKSRTGAVYSPHPTCLCDGVPGPPAERGGAVRRWRDVGDGASARACAMLFFSFVRPRVSNLNPLPPLPAASPVCPSPSRPTPPAGSACPPRSSPACWMRGRPCPCPWSCGWCRRREVRGKERGRGEGGGAHAGPVQSNAHAFFFS